MAMDAFDLAERFQQLVFVMSDLDLGMNMWMAHPFAYPEKALDRGKVLDAESIKALGVGVGPLQGRRRRRHSVPHDSRAPACRRTSRAARATTSAASTASAPTTTSATSIAWRASTRRRRSTCRSRSSRTRRRRSASSPTAPATGRSSRAAPSSRRKRASRPPTCASARIRSPAEVDAFLARYPRVYLVEQNRDAQLKMLLRNDLPAGGDQPRAQRPALQRPADRRAVADRRHPRAGREEGGAPLRPPRPRPAARRRPAPRNNQPWTPHRRRRTPARRRTASGSRCSRIAAARRRCAPAAATTRSPSASSTPSSRWASTRSDVIKLSGIGCSSKSPAYFLGDAHGFNSVHGRMPSVGTGALLANGKMIAIGISGDGDTGAIGIGQFVHMMRRNVPMVYIIEDNGCYGLTKGQFSPTADVGSTLKNGVVNDLPPIDTCMLADPARREFVARSFSGDKKQLLSILKASLSPPRHGDDRRHLAVRDLQRPRGLDQELRLRQGARRGRWARSASCRSSRTSPSSTTPARPPPSRCTTARSCS